MQKPESIGPSGAIERGAEQALLEGLRRVPVPSPSPAFDDRVLAALALPEAEPDAMGWTASLRVTIRAWWNGPSIQLMLSGAVCAVIVTLGAYALSVNTPIAGPVVTPSGAGVAAATRADSDEWYRATVEAGTYRGLLLAVPSPAPKPTKPETNGDRRRGSGGNRSRTPGTARMPRVVSENRKEA